MHRCSFIAHCPQGVRRRVATVALPAAHKTGRRALQDIHYLLPRAVWRCITGGPYALPLGRVAAQWSDSTANCLQTMWECIVAF